MIDRFSRRALACALFASTSLFGISATPAQAQMKRPMPDEHGIDVIAGAPYIRSGSLTIGDPAQGGLQFYRVWKGLGQTFNNLTGTVSVNGSAVTVTVGESVETFTQSGTTYTSDDGRGSTLVSGSPFSGWWTYTLADGTVIVFENPGTLSTLPNIKGMLRTITRPNGLVTTFTNKYQYFCERSGSSCVGQSVRYARLQSVTTTAGYQLHLDYATNITGSGTPDISLIDTWEQLTVATGINNAVDYCDPSADTCSLTQNWPTVTISQSGGTDTWVDALSQTTTSQVTSGQLVSIQSPSNPGTDFNLTYDSNARVASFSQGGAAPGTTLIRTSGRFALRR